MTDPLNIILMILIYNYSVIGSSAVCLYIPQYVFVLF